MRENIYQTPEEKIRDRMPQAKEMETIWDIADDETRAYLRGCIVTAQALYARKAG